MKKLALTNLIVLLAIKSVSACSYPEGYIEPVSVLKGNEYYFWGIFFGSFILLIPIVVLYYRRKRQGLWTIIASILSLVFFIPLLLLTAVYTMCSNGAGIAAVIIAEFFLMFLLFLYQLISWITQRKMSRKLP